MTRMSPDLSDHLPRRLPRSGFSCLGFVSSCLMAWSSFLFVWMSSLRKPFSNVRVVRSLYFSRLLQLRDEFVVVSCFLCFYVFVGFFFWFSCFFFLFFVF